MMGRRVIELYDAFITGNDWEVTSYLSLKRRAGHSQYVTVNYPALNMVSWKSNTMGTIPVIDTTKDIEYISGSTPVSTAILSKTVTTQCGMIGIGNYFYMGNTVSNVKWDGPSGSQGVTNWGISITNSSATYGPDTAGTGASFGSGPVWSTPSNITGSAGYATQSITNPNAPAQGLQATNFGFSVPATSGIIGIQVSFNAFASASPSSIAELGVFLLKGGAIVGSIKKVVPPTSSGAITLGSSADTWGASFTPNDINGSGFGFVIYQQFTGVNGTATYHAQDGQITIFTNSGLSPNPTGSGTFSAVNGYTYVYAYGNSVSGEISNASPPSANTGPFTNVAYVGLAVVASSDPQVNQIRIYRTTDSGGGNQFFEISNSPFPNVSATLQDTTADTSLQVTSQAEINLGNTPPPAGLINLEWFSGRLWGSVNNLLYASTGPETLSGTAPQSNWNPLFQWVIPGPIIKNVAGPNGMLVYTQDDCYIVRGTDITNYTINEFIKDMGIRSFNCVDTDGTNMYVFTSDRQLIQISSSGANDLGLPIGDQMLNVDPTQAYVTVNRYGLDSILRILDVANNIYYDFNLNQQCWNLPGILQMTNCSAAGSIEVSPGVWRLMLCSNTTLAFRDLSNFADLGNTYQPNAVFGTIQVADPGTLAKIGAIGGIVLETTNVGIQPSLSILPNDTGATLSNAVGSQITGAFVNLSTGRNPLPSPPTLGAQASGYRSLVYYYASGKGLSSFVKHFQFQISAPSQNAATELLGFCIFGDQKQETSGAAPIPQIQGR
jgi:hypothetical protein